MEKSEEVLKGKIPEEKVILIKKKMERIQGQRKEEENNEQKDQQQVVDSEIQKQKETERKDQTPETISLEDELQLLLDESFDDKLPKLPQNIDNVSYHWKTQKQ